MCTGYYYCAVGVPRRPEFFSFFRAPRSSHVAVDQFVRLRREDPRHAHWERTVMFSQVLATATDRLTELGLGEWTVCVCLPLSLSLCRGIRLQQLMTLVSGVWPG